MENMAQPVVKCGLGGCDGRESVDIAVIEAEECRDEDRVVQFAVGRALLPVIPGKFSFKGI